MDSPRIKAAAIVVFVGVAAVSAVCAAQAWKRKPPEQWTEKDAKKVLYDSPWAQTVMMPYHPYTAQGAKPEQRIGAKLGRLPTTLEDPLAPIARPDWALIVQWSSSRTIRRAEKIADPDGLFRHTDRDDRPLSVYRVTVMSSSLTNMLPDWREADLERSTWLKFGPRGEEIPPQQVRVERTPGADRAEAYIFTFPTRDGNGEPLLRRGVTIIHFYCQLGPVAMRAEFEPAKMVAHDGPDI